jgi:hypothetical protein
MEGLSFEQSLLPLCGALNKAPESISIFPPLSFTISVFTKKVKSQKLGEHKPLEAQIQVDSGQCLNHLAATALV